MKKVYFIIATAILLVSSVCLMASSPGILKKDKKEGNPPVVKGEVTVDKTVHDFGTISENGGIVTTTFTIRNNMDNAILINKVTASCGCTTPSWTKEPIEKGKKGEITVSYNPKGRVAPFNKTVTILTSGNPERIVVSIKGVVE